jgi:hypothetical protein
MPEPQDALPPSPWHIEHAIGGPIVWGPNGELVIVLGSQPKHLALADLLLRAPQVEQAARALYDLCGDWAIESIVLDPEGQARRDAWKCLRVALGEQK